MDAALEAEIIDRGIRERERTAYPDGFPALPPVPAARYVDAAFAELEEQWVFGRSWLFVAHVEELASAGDFITLRQFREPIFLVRGDDLAIRAFYNTCQHRGAPLVAGASGNAGRRLVCPYHSWTYDLGGELVGIPSPCDWADPSTTRECLSLQSIRCEVWGSFVFINLADDAPPLRDALGAVGTELDAQIGDGPDVGPVHLLDRRSIEVAGNWKLTVDANIETYHVNTVHRNTAALLLDQQATGISLLDMGHSRMLVHNRDEKPFPVDLPAFPSASRLAGFGIYSYHLFPNTSIVFGGTPAILFCISSWPMGPDRSFYDVHFMAPTPIDGEHGDMLSMLVDANWMVLQEDLGNLESMQRSMACGSLRTIPLSYQERRIYHQHEEIDRRIGSDRMEAALRVPPLLGGFVES